MNTELRNTEVGRLFYNQLRLTLVYPGDTIGGQRRMYEPVNKLEPTWDELMLLPDTPTVARYRLTRETNMWFALAEKWAS